VWGRPGNAVFGITCRHIIRREDRDRRQAADVFTEHAISPTNDTRRGMRTEVREARAGERRMGTALAFLGQ